jgi:coenzyme F420-reducing hydrogenase alpha subunit
MKDSNPSPRQIRVPILTRVEGEGSLVVKLRGSAVEDVQLVIFEPPRLFEALLRGRPFSDVADITARICGICPIAYQMTAVQALEQAFDVRVTPEIRLLRRLMYCGEWIESHALHMHLLQAPDFFGLESGIQLAEQYPMEVKRGLRLKKIGNALLEALGGRAIHPVNLAVGGFYRLPTAPELQALIPDFEWGLTASIEAVRWLAALPFPDFHCRYDYVAMQHPDEYAIIQGDVVCSDGLRIPHPQYETHFEEIQVPHSTALQSRRLPAGQPYFVGPLARLNLNRARLAEPALRTADEIGWETPCHNPYQGIVARGLEVVHAFAEGLDILRGYRPHGPARADFTVRAGEGSAVTEAPRGLIFHRYQVDAQGRIQFAKIVPPTSQNQAQIEQDLRQLLEPELLEQPDDQIALECEKLVRNYDPCISCSTHFLKLHLVRQ